MSAFDASPAVIVLTTIGVLAAVYGFVCGLRRDRRAREVYDWVRQAYPDAPGQLAPHLRWFPSRRVGLAVLRRQRIVVSQEFESRYAVLRRLERLQLVAMSVVACSVTLVLIGTRFWGWRW